jgi:hypothetical protein
VGTDRRLSEAIAITGPPVGGPVATRLTLAC